MNKAGSGVTGRVQKPFCTRPAKSQVVCQTDDVSNVKRFGLPDA